MAGTAAPLTSRQRCRSRRHVRNSLAPFSSRRHTEPMSTAMTASYQIHAIPATVLDNARRSGVDVSGNAVEQIISEGGEPLRCCLRDARPDEPCILFGYEPPIRASPFREIGAVFAHAERCGGPASDVDYPSDWISRPQILRAYDSRGWIHPATKMHDGSDPESVITQMLADADVVQIHSRNIAYGCYMFTVTRAGWTGQPSSSETCQVDRSADCVERAHDASRSVPAPSAAVSLLSGSSLPSPAAPDRLPLQPAGTEDSVRSGGRRWSRHGGPRTSPGRARGLTGRGRRRPAACTPSPRARQRPPAARRPTGCWPPAKSGGSRDLPPRAHPRTRL